MALEGNYKSDQLNLLNSNLRAFRFFNEQLGAVDSEIEQLLPCFSDGVNRNLSAEPVTDPVEKPETKEVKRKRGRPRKHPEGRNNPGKNDLNTSCDLARELTRINGIDLTVITGLGANTVLQIMSEVGTDMSKFHSAKHFASYLGFTPHNKVTGGVIISSRTDRIKSHAAQAFKKVVPSISRGKSALAAFYRRIAARVGTGKAIVAVCRKLAIIYYNAVTEGIQFVEKGAECYRKQQEDREKKYLEKLARKHNFALAPVSLSN